MAASMLQGWASPLRELVDTADPDSVSYFRFNAADPDAELTPWPSGPSLRLVTPYTSCHPPAAGEPAPRSATQACSPERSRPRPKDTRPSVWPFTTSSVEWLDMHRRRCARRWRR